MSGTIDGKDGMRRLLRLPLASFVVLGAWTQARADAIVVVRAMKASTIMEAFLDDETLRLEIEMGLADAPAFVNLLPEEIYDGLGLADVPLEERQNRFFTEDLVLAADGAPLLGRLVSTEPRSRTVRDEISGEPVAAPSPCQAWGGRNPAASDAPGASATAGTCSRRRSRCRG